MSYNGFPYYSFIDSNIRNQLELKNSPNNRIRNLIAWAKITSGVYEYNKNIKLYSIISFISQKHSVNLTFNEIYDSNNMLLGGLESIEVEYLSKYGGIRKATLNLKFNSLEQFKKFAPYFLSPGRSMIVEWGWTEGSSYILTEDEYSLVADNKVFSDAWKVFNDRAKKSNGTYDGMIGIITNYDFSLDTESSGFKIKIEVTSAGSLMYSLNLTNQAINTNSETGYKTIKDFIKNDFLTVISESREKGIPKWIWKLNSDSKFVFNSPDIDVYYIENNKQLENYFVTWGFIEEVIVNSFVGIKSNKDNKEIFKIRSVYSNLLYNASESRLKRAKFTEKCFVPIKISNHVYLRSTNLSICFISNISDSKRTSFFKLDTIDNKLYDSKTGEVVELELDKTEDYSFGYLRHIYVNAKVVYDAFMNSDVLTDALLNILNQINSACLNYWDFNLKINEETQTMTVIDANYNNTSLKSLIEKEKKNDTIKNIYLFKTFGGNSFIHSINFTSKLPNEITITSLYGMNKTDNYIINRDNESFKSIWNPNKLYGDYFISSLKFETQKNEVNTSEDEKTNVTKLKKQSYNEKYTSLHKHLLTAPDEKEDDLDYNKRMVYRYINENNDKINILIPVEFEMEIEGISGLKIGDIFWIDCVPDEYIEKSVFQITRVNHSIADNYWKTKIVAMLRIIGEIRDGGIKASEVRTQTKTNAPYVYAKKNYTDEEYEKNRDENIKKFDSSELSFIKNEKRKKIIEVANNEIGIIEFPVNFTKYGKWFNFNGNAWCAMFVSWVFHYAGYPLPKLQSGPSGFSWVQGAFNKSKLIGTTYINNITYAEPGDLILYNLNPENDHERFYDHIGIFVKKIDNNKIATIEGNTSAYIEKNINSKNYKEEINGGCVSRKNRPITFKYAIIKPKILL